MMADFDRELIEVITDVDDEVWELRELVELRGATVVSRVIYAGDEPEAIAEVRSRHGRE